MADIDTQNVREQIPSTLKITPLHGVVDTWIMARDCSARRPLRSAASRSPRGDGGRVAHAGGGCANYTASCDTAACCTLNCTSWYGKRIICVVYRSRGGGSATTPGCAYSCTTSSAGISTCATSGGNCTAGACGSATASIGTNARSTPGSADGVTPTGSIYRARD